MLVVAQAKGIWILTFMKKAEDRHRPTWTGNDGKAHNTMDIEDGSVQDEEARVRRRPRDQAGGGAHFRTTKLVATRRRALDDEPKAVAARAQGYRSLAQFWLDVTLTVFGWMCLFNEIVFWLDVSWCKEMRWFLHTKYTRNFQFSSVTFSFKLMYIFQCFENNFVPFREVFFY